MRSVLILTLLSLCFLPLQLVSANSVRGIKVIKNLTHQNHNVGNYRALIIGINDYQDNQIPDLETAKNDAIAIAEVLQKSYGFKINHQTDLLLDRKATRKAIYMALRKLATSTEPSDSVLIFYAGHGDLDKAYNDGWWIPADAKAGDPLTYLENVQVQKAMKNMTARHVLLISDSCYSGTLFGESRSMPPVITDKYYLGLFNEKSRWGMTSGNKTPVADSGNEGHSVFAYQLLKELRKNEKPYLSAQELYTRIAPIISNNSEEGQVPLCKPIKRTGDMGGQFIFIASSGSVIDSPVTKDYTKTRLSVKSNVSNAKVYLDGQYVGNTDLIDARVMPGQHRVRVEKEGYEPYNKEKNFREGREKSLQAILDKQAPSKGSLSVRTDPQSVTIRILNIAPKFYQGMELTPGDYHLEISAKGYAIYKEWITIAAGDDKELDIRLTPLHSESTTTSNSIGPKEKFKNSLGMKFVYIKPGTFMMGSPSKKKDRDIDETQHKVTLTKGFYMQTTEVTQGQWKAVMDNKPSYFKHCGDNCPVENVSWEDAQQFIRELNQRESGRKYRLPTEAEWEYAARAGTTTTFSFGECLSTNQANYDGNYPYSGCSKGRYREKTISVASFSPNSWGLYDMHGNVWEWCQDWYGSYPSNSITDPSGPTSGSDRVLRGGSWSSSAWWCRSVDRHDSLPGSVGGDIGFRLCLSRGQ